MTNQVWSEKMNAITDKNRESHKEYLNDPENIIGLEHKLATILYTITTASNTRFKGRKQVSFERLVRVINTSIKKLKKLQRKLDHWSHRWESTMLSGFDSGRRCEAEHNLFLDKVCEKYHNARSKYRLELACLKQATDRLKPEFGIDWEETE